jgi:hypothetical protein
MSAPQWTSPAEIPDLLRDLAAATAALLAGVGGLVDAEAAAPSLLPGWSRPAVRLRATDTGRVFVIGEADAGTVSGPEHELLGWLLGRSAGGALIRCPAGPLLDVPDAY